MGGRCAGAKERAWVLEMADLPLFGEVKLTDNLNRDLHRLNPWWQGRPMQLLPKTRRHLVSQMQRRLGAGLAPIVVVRGPRQIGKTIAQLHVIEDLLAQNVAPERIFRVQYDDLPELTHLSEPILRLVDWYESTILGKSLNQAARDNQNHCRTTISRLRVCVGISRKSCKNLS